jgi:hypothetical protein
LIAQDPELAGIVKLNNQVKSVKTKTQFIHTKCEEVHKLYEEIDKDIKELSRAQNNLNPVEKKGKDDGKKK